MGVRLGQCQHIGLGVALFQIRKAKMPKMRLLMLPIEALIKHDNWYTLGLCGSSSGDVEAVNIRVPHSHSFSILTEPRVHAPLYRMPYLVCWPAALPPSLWVMAAPLDDFIDLAKPNPTGTGKTLAQRATAQALAEAEATWRAASYFWQTLEDVWAVIKSDTPLDENLRADFRWPPPMWCVRPAGGARYA